MLASFKEFVLYLDYPSIDTETVYQEILDIEREWEGLINMRKFYLEIVKYNHQFINLEGFINTMNNFHDDLK